MSRILLCLLSLGIVSAAMGADSAPANKELEQTSRHHYIVLFPGFRYSYDKSTTSSSEVKGEDADGSAEDRTGFGLGMSGLRLGGLTGLSGCAKLGYVTGTGVDPYLDGALGLSGGKYGVGVLWTIDSRPFRMDHQHLGFASRLTTGLSVKLVMVHRWNGEDDRLEAWYGKNLPEDRYVGVEVDVVMANFGITPGIYRSQTTGEHYGAVSYGLGF